MTVRKAGIYIEPGRILWPQERRIANVLALAGYYVEFLLERINLPTADIRLDGVEYEIKSPETAKLSSIEQLIRKALKQSPNIIIDAARCKIRSDKLVRYLCYKCREQRQIKGMLLVTKGGQIIDVVKMARGS